MSDIEEVGISLNNNGILNNSEKKKKKKKKKHPKQTKNELKTDNELNGSNILIQYVSANNDLDESDPLYNEFSQVFNKFSKPEELCKVPGEKNENDKDNELNKNGVKLMDDQMNIDIDGEKPLSKKKKKIIKRASVADLKQQVPRPDVVEVWDVTSADPKLLVYLKAYRNTVPVPRHWCQKRKYLQGKRGIEKPPFQLPDFIAATGIDKIRQAVLEKEEQKEIKTKTT